MPAEAFGGRPMWRRVEVQARVDRPVELVFDHLADPETWPTFVPAVVMRRRLDEGPVRVGSRWILSRDFVRLEQILAAGTGPADPGRS